MSPSEGRPYPNILMWEIGWDEQGHEKNQYVFGTGSKKEMAQDEVGEIYRGQIIQDASKILELIFQTPVGGH